MLLCSKSSKVAPALAMVQKKKLHPFLKENSPRVRSTNLYPDGIVNDHNTIIKDASNMASQLDEALCHSLFCMWTTRGWDSCV